ncbi:class A beta-lactamase-related serine hydrolase [bacterium]|nr:MAG: class A beta-lactamase-related serine hydrolase [bacterium]
MVTRRNFLTSLATTAAASALPSVLTALSDLDVAQAAEAKLSKSEQAAIAAITKQFMQDFGVPGLSVAVTRHASLVYQGAFGTPDAKRPAEKLTANHLFRIASVTKPITSTAIFSLIESGDLELDHRIFGPGGYLGDDYGKASPANVRRITLHHLLTHTAGGWGNSAGDPMFSNPNMNHRQLIEWTLLNKPLQYEPGVHYEYSNFGYCVLGRIIEKFSRKSYIEAVKKSVLSRCSIRDMRLATNEQAPNEVRYLGQNGENPYSPNMNISRMDSHGGWLATPTDLVRFATRVDGFETSPQILRAKSIRTMTTPTAANANYACGWCVNSRPNWWHNGSLPGTSTILVRTASGLCWAAFANTRTKGIDLALDLMMWKLAKAVPAWQA